MLFGIRYIIILAYDYVVILEIINLTQKINNLSIV